MQQLFAYFNRFHELSPKGIDAIKPLCSLVHLKKNEELQHIGETCRTIYFIKKGIARIYYKHQNIDVTESFTTENNIVVRVKSLFTGMPSRKGIHMLENSEVVAINATQLFKLYDEHPELERLFRKIFESLHVEVVCRLESLQFHTAEERYKNLMEEHSDIIQRVPLKYIASYLGITQTSLSRVRAAH